MLNKVQIIGNLGALPETRTTPNGTVIATLRVATTSRVKKGDEWADHTEWHRVVCFGRTAENCAKYLRKGRQVYVEGEIRTRKWTDEDGNEKYMTEIIGNDIKFLGGGKRDDSPSSNTGNNYTKPDDDIPF